MSFDCPKTKLDFHESIHTRGLIFMLHPWPTSNPRKTVESHCIHVVQNFRCKLAFVSQYESFATSNSCCSLKIMCVEQRQIHQDTKTTILNLQKFRYTYVHANYITYTQTSA